VYRVFIRNYKINALFLALTRRRWELRLTIFLLYVISAPVANGRRTQNLAVSERATRSSRRVKYAKAGSGLMPDRGRDPVSNDGSIISGPSYQTGRAEN